MTATGSTQTPAQAATAAAETEFEARRKQFGGNVKLAQVFAREAYDKAYAAAARQQ